MEAYKLIEEAKNKESSYWYYFTSKMLCTSETLEESILELYMKAGNLYHINKDYENAVQAYINASEYYLKIGNYIEMIDCYNKIQSCYMNLNKHYSAIKYIKKCSDYYFSKNKLNEAIKYEIKIAEIYEKKYEYSKAIDNYKMALSCSIDNNNTSNSCLIKIADLYVSEYDLNNAVKYYESYLINIANEKLLKYRYSEIIFKIILCHIGIKSVNVIEKIKSYSNNFLIFDRSIEHEFLVNLISIVEEKNISNFERLLNKYNLIKKLDNILISLFTFIKGNLEELENIDFK